MELEFDEALGRVTFPAQPCKRRLKVFPPLCGRALDRVRSVERLRHEEGGLIYRTGSSDLRAVQFPYLPRPSSSSLPVPPFRAVSKGKNIWWKQGTRAEVHLGLGRTRRANLRAACRADIRVWPHGVVKTVASDRLCSSSYDASAKQTRSRHSEATAEMRPYGIAGSWKFHGIRSSEPSSEPALLIPRMPRVCRLT